MEESLDKYILNSFDTALAEGKIQVYYQPVIRTISRQLCSFEALARWDDPTHGMLRPDEFIPVLEREKLIHKLDGYVIGEVCRRIRRTIESRETPIPVSINLSRMDFTLCNIFTVLDGCARANRIPHDFLYIEITESVLAEQEGQMRDVVERFQKAGYQIWMDDFGSGYSSLNMLKDYSFDELKLDMRFLSSFSQRSRRILTSVVQMAKEIGMHTLAEGVETEEQFSYLRNIGCEKVQGFYFGKPLPYEKAVAALREKGITVELPRHRRYYDDIGRIDFLSAVPFLGRSEKKLLVNGRQLNSIPLALAELKRDSFSLLFCNSAFEENVSGIEFLPEPLRSWQPAESFPLSVIPARLISLLENTRAEGSGRMLFVSHEEYYELKTKCIAKRLDAYSVLLQLNNLSQASQATRTTRLDEGLRQIYALFDRITLIDINADSITPLYVGMADYLTSKSGGIRQLACDFAERWIYPEDQGDYLQLWELSTLEKRLEASGRSFISGYFRCRMSDGQYNWKQIIILHFQPGVVFELIHNAQAELSPFMLRESASDAISPEMLWNNLIRSDVVRLFWKDRERRFLGVSRGFLEYYGFSSPEDVIGKTDEELSWHVHPDLYMNDELRVIHEGITTHNIPGKCISNGENREILANKTPLFNDSGEIVGLLGSFIDRELLNMYDLRGQDTASRDGLTGLLNSRGLFEHVHAFQDEYYLRGTDFIRLHVSIDDLASINRQYGYDFGDRVIAVLGNQLKKAFGINSAVGRINGYQFVILHQIHSKNEASSLRSSVRQIGESIQDIDGTPVTLYLSTGYSLYSECEDLDEMTQNAEMRLLADHDDHAPVERRMSYNSDFFRLYDDLPISFAVYKVQVNRRRKVTDAVLFYANHLFEQRAQMSVKEMLGVSVKKLFPMLDARWYEMAGRAALYGETIVDTMYFAGTDKQYYLTANQIIHSGYCSVTYQELDSLGRPMDPGAV